MHIGWDDMHRGNDIGVNQHHGSFYIVLPEKAVELNFDIGGSGVCDWEAADFPIDRSNFIEGLVALVVEETAGGNIMAASKVAGLLADYYSHDVVVLDAQLQHGDTLVGEMHFVDGISLADRKEKAHAVLDLCTRPSLSQMLH
jgi:hypothetical protein